MRDSLVALLICPVCGARSWSLSAIERGAGEVVSGQLDCLGCGRSFPLRDGAVDFLAHEKPGGGTVLLPQGPLMPTEPLDFLFRAFEYDNPDGRCVLALDFGEPFQAAAFAHLGFRVVALDSNLGRLDCRRVDRDGASADRLRAAMTRIPLDARSVDIVFARAALGHAAPHCTEDFHPHDPANLLDALAELRRVLKPDGLFVVADECEFPEELGDEDRQAGLSAAPPGRGHIAYRRCEYEWAFCQAGLLPHLWLQWREKHLCVGTLLGGHYREMVTPGDSINRHSHFLLSAPALKRDLDTCLGGWARVRPWPAQCARLPRPGGPLPLGEPDTFVDGWQPPESNTGGPFRWMGHQAAVVVFEIEPMPGPLALELQVRAYSPLGAFRAALFLEREGRPIAREVTQPGGAAALGDQELRLQTDLDKGPIAVRCIADSQMRLYAFLNGEYLATFEVPPDGKFHTCHVDLPHPYVRKLNQLTFEPAYALRPCDCTASTDSRRLSCAVRDLQIRPKTDTAQG